MTPLADGRAGAQPLAGRAPSPARRRRSADGDATATATTGTDETVHDHPGRPRPPPGRPAVPRRDRGRPGAERPRRAHPRRPPRDAGGAARPPDRDPPHRAGRRDGHVLRAARALLRSLRRVVVGAGRSRPADLMRQGRRAQHRPGRRHRCRGPGWPTPWPSCRDTLAPTLARAASDPGRRRRDHRQVVVTRTSTAVGAVRGLPHPPGRHRLRARMAGRRRTPP